MPSPKFFTVTGKWPFPADMLRRDHAQPATLGDEALVQLLSKDHCDGSFDLRKTYKIVLRIPAEHARFGPNEARWESFGWKVSGVDKETSDASPSDHFGKEVEQLRERALRNSIRDRIEGNERLRAAVQAYVTATNAYTAYKDANSYGSEWEPLYRRVEETYAIMVSILEETRHS